MKHASQSNKPVSLGKSTLPAFQLTVFIALGIILSFPQFAAAQDTTPPSEFELLIPGNNSVTYATTYGDKARLAWQESSDNGSGVDHYEIWMDGSNVDNIPAGVYGHFPGEWVNNYEPFRPYGNLDGEKVCYYTPPVSKLSVGTHQWYVKAVDKDGNKRQSSSTFKFTVGSTTDSVKIFVSHTGYLSNGNNRVVVDGSIGASKFEVVDSGGKSIFSGDLKSGGKAFGDYLVGDFTGIEGAGSYRIKAGSEFSMWFSVGLETKLNYETYFRKYRNAHTRKRCGNTTLNWGRKACHLDDARMEGSKRHEVVGGWHSSSDVRKIMRCTLPGVLAFLDMKRLINPAWDGGEYNILDEIKWANKYIYKMQLENGAVAHHHFLWCDVDGWGESANKYTNNTIGDADDRLLPDNTIKIDMINQSHFIENETLIYRMYKDSDPVYANQSLALATKCYNYFQKTWPVVTDYETAYIARPYPEPITELMPLAYGIRANLNMFLATGNTTYKERSVALADKFIALQETSYIAGQTEVKGFFYKNKKKDSIFSSLMAHGYIDGAPGGIILLSELYEAFPTHAKAPKWKESLRSYLEDYLLPLSKKNAFGIVPAFLSLQKRAFGQSADMVRNVGGLNYQFLGTNRGGSKFLTRKALLFAKGFKIIGNPEFRDAAWRQINWVTGNNPYNSSTVFGIGHRQLRVFKEWLSPPHDGIAMMGVGGVGGKDTPYMRSHWRWTEMDIFETVWFARTLFELLSSTEGTTPWLLPKTR
jgi:hypothetical protein